MQIRRLYALLVLLFASILAMGAQPPATSMLWEVSGQGLSQPSYLFGTIHLICEEQFRFSPTIDSALQQTAQLVLELDLDAPDLTMQMAALSNQATSSLSQSLSPAEFEQVDAFFMKHYGLGFAMLENEKPIQLISMALPRIMACAVRSYELELLTKGKNLALPVKGLETLAQQYTMMDEISDNEQAKWLAELIINKESAAQLYELARLYVANTPDSLLGQMLSDERSAAYADVLLYRRNAAWIDPIIRHMHDKPSFIAVGAGHLAGESGVIALLQARGYKLRPMMLAAE